jgi:hypothetical protein
LPSALFFIVGISLLVAIFLKISIVSSKLILTTIMLMIVYFSVFMNQYTRIYKVLTLIPQDEVMAGEEMIKRVSDLYNFGDQIFMFPTHYNDIYFPFFWRMYPNRQYKILADGIRNDIPIEKISAQSHLRQQDTHIIFVDNNLIFDPAQKHYGSEYVSSNQRYYDLAESLCAQKPDVVFFNTEWKIYVCNLGDDEIR